MENKEIAMVLDEIGRLLKLQATDPFKVIAYQRAAKAVESWPGSIADMARDGTLKQIRGIGDTLKERITDLVTHGEMAYHTQLKEATPPGLTELLPIPGLGPKKIKQLWETQGVDSLAALERLIDSGGLEKAKGFGKKSVEKVAAGIARLRSFDGQVILATALPLARRLVELLQACPEVIRCSEAGSVRRRREVCHDIDIVASTADPAAVSTYFRELPLVEEVTESGETKTSVRLKGGIDADLRVVTDAQYPATLVHFTGSKEHNVRLRERAKAAGRKINEYGVFEGETPLDVPDEAAFFALFDLPWIAPELREDAGELEAAGAGELPDLVRYDQIRGTFHCHTTASDGIGTLEEMVEMARELGWEYLGISDHSQTSSYAGGLTPERLRAQMAEIDALNETLDDFVVLKGSEVDILPDGSLDFEDDLLADLDFVVASIHSNFSMPRDEMTARVLRAIDHPFVNLIAHPTGRLLLKRDGYDIDLDALIARAAATGTCLEINASPLRLELDAVHCRKASAAHVPISINPDAHQPSALRNVALGVDVARRGWLSRDDVLNTRPWGEIQAIFAAKQRT